MTKQYTRNIFSFLSSSEICRLQMPEEQAGKPPLKAERKKCWDARDLYWKCLTDNPADAEKCREQRKKYEESCPSTWVRCLGRLAYTCKKKK